MIEIAVASDDAYLPWTATLMASVLDHHRPPSVVFHLLHDGLDPGGLGTLAEFVERRGATLDHHDVASAACGLPAVGRFPRIVWSRFLLPDLLPRTDRVLYVDADTFVTGPLDELWATDLGNEVLAAVPNVVERGMQAHVRSLGVDPARFLNSGVLLMDLGAMRRGDTLRDLEAFVRRAEHLRWPDQDALNVLYRGRWLALHPRWNAMNSLWTYPDEAAATYGGGVAREAMDDPVIVHFEGPSISKPWHVLCSHPLRGAYRLALSRTPWASAPLTGRTVLNRALSALPSRWWTRSYVAVARLRNRVAKLTGRS